MEFVNQFAKTMSSSVTSPPTILNLGCGRKRKQGAVNLDCTVDTNPDVVHDLNTYPWPFEGCTFKEIWAYDVLEHLEDLTKCLEEIHRIGNAGARVYITVPHFSCANAFRDPTHRHFFSYFTLDYFTAEHPLSFYSKCRFRRAKAQLVFCTSLVNKIVWRVANRFPAAYENRWAWIFPAWFLSFELEVLKDPCE